jgi:proteasome lid subunit RPN8/RPN11
MIEFTQAAWRNLRSEVIDSADDRETGGALFGQIRGGRVVVARICGPSYWTERATDTFRVERDRYLALERTLPDEVVWVGDWHSHDELTARPSESDFAGWTGMLRRAVGAYVGVIVTPDPRVEWRFDAPRFAAWLATADGVARATLIGGD